MNLTKLNNRIEVKKKELIHLVEKYGFSHDKVISLSQDLDRLLNLLTKLNTSVSRRSNPANKEKRCSF
ncbi:MULTISPECIES: aspartyl-phosphate phosphatase Spo0E family protein [Bacillus]|uniref:aspartyl-phosphate phosphatase Spo0E family protein n=1 Tax=Bacillus TaxID=1386 RepID=UPI00115AC989|nr:MULTISPECIES: aspartyl-phosphate phosphatase Spo0E family protein [Bacillus]